MSDFNEKDYVEIETTEMESTDKKFDANTATGIGIIAVAAVGVYEGGKFVFKKAKNVYAKGKQKYAEKKAAKQKAPVETTAEVVSEETK